MTSLKYVRTEQKALNHLNLKITNENHFATSINGQNVFNNDHTWKILKYRNSYFLTKAHGVTATLYFQIYRFS